MAHRFFSDLAPSADLTGLDKTLIHHFAIILQTISCRFAVNTAAFDVYVMDTARLFVSLYGWYYMPASVHKILHGSEISLAALLPIGQLSEEAQEARNKDLKKFRESFTRKISKEETNKDLMRRLLVALDPVISAMRCLPNLKKRSLMHEVLQLLDSPSISALSMETESSGEEEIDSL